VMADRLAKETKAGSSTTSHEKFCIGQYDNLLNYHEFTEP
jgi:hypothetical protein